MDDDTDQAGAPPADPFAGLDAEAQRLDAAAIPADPNAPPPPDVGAEARECVEFVASMVLPILPERYSMRYGQAEQRRIAAAAEAWAIARNVSVGDLLGKWMPEIALIGAVFGPVLPVIVSDLRERDKRQAHQAQHQAPAGAA